MIRPLSFRPGRRAAQKRLEELNPNFLGRKGDKTVPGMEQARPSVGRVVAPGQVRPDGDTDASDIRPDGDTEANASELASEPRTKIRRADGAGPPPWPRALLELPSRLPAPAEREGVSGWSILLLRCSHLSGDPHRHVR